MMRGIVVLLCCAANAAGRQRNNFATFGRISFRDSARSALSTSLSPSSTLSDTGTSSLLDTSSWLASTQYQQVRIGATSVDDLVEYYAKPDRTTRSRPDARATTLVASLRGKRAPHQRQEEAITTIEPEILQAIVQPFVPKSIWSRLQGREFDEPGVIDAMVENALSVASSSPKDSDWITWKEHSSKDEVQVHIGRCAKLNADDYHGANLPVIRTEAVVENMTPQEMAELMLDSTRVQEYNKLSLGRKDVRSLSSCIEGLTKIVCNLTQPPITKKKMKSTTLMHTRVLEKTGTHVIVSRAIPSSSSDHDEYTISEIVLGVNMFSPHGDNGMKMTTMTHVYSAALPAVLATRVGVSSAINFVKDIRNVGSTETEDAEVMAAAAN